MKKQRIKARVSDLVLNEGQIEWLPKNPRQWSQEDVDRTKASLERDADFQEDRPLLVLKHDDKFLVFAGNLRTTSAKELKWDSLEAVLYTPESEDDCVTIKRRAMLDNGSFGEWDWDALANEWDDQPLADWGIPASFLGEGNWDSLSRIEEQQKLPDLVQKITVTIPPIFVDKMEDIKAAIEVTIAEWDGVKVS